MVIALVIGATADWRETTLDVHPINYPYTASAFLLGSATSMLVGWLGVKIALFASVRTTVESCKDFRAGFMTALRGGQVLGFGFVGLALLMLYVLLIAMKRAWLDEQWESLGARFGEEGVKGRDWNQLSAD